MDELHELAITGLSWLILAVPAGLVCLALRGLLPAADRRLLPWPRPRPVPWLGVDVWAAFTVLLLVPVTFAALLQESGLFTLVYGKAANADTDLMQGRRMLWAGALALPFEVALILGGLAALRGARLAQVGLTGRRAAQNVAAGYLTWLVLAPAALLLYWAVTLLVPAQKHPFEQLSNEPLFAVEWAAVVFLAVVAAPLMEELVFRGVLLPWQTGRGLDAQLIVGVAALAFSILGGAGKKPFNPGPMCFVLALLPGYALVPYLARRWRLRGRLVGGAAGREDPAQDSARGDGSALWDGRVSRGVAAFMHLASDRRVNVLLALYGNGLLFAALHSSVWPSPVALFPLGVGLAWLAYRTQSLVGPVVAHALFNGVACLDMFLS